MKMKEYQSYFVAKRNASNKSKKQKKKKQFYKNNINTYSSGFSPHWLGWLAGCEGIHG